MKKDSNRIIKRSLYIVALICIIYAAGRLYYHMTDGFMVSNITSENTFDPQWETHSLAANELQAIQSILQQDFHYLGKGCQSYVFASDDGKYVLKFFKYQRLRPKDWIKYLNFIPFVEKYYENKLEIKRRKMEVFFRSWKIAFDKAQEETGIVYVHLNKSDYLKTELKIFDKMGFEHRLNLDDFEFMVQKRGSMLCDVINQYMAAGELAKAESMLENLVRRIIAQNQRGIADNDHALMQNTGVVDGIPMHIDVGQFVYDDQVKDPQFFMQELFTKTYKFRKWLKKEHPKLAEQFDSYLQTIYGDQFTSMKPVWRDKIEMYRRNGL